MLVVTRPADNTRHQIHDEIPGRTLQTGLVSPMLADGAGVWIVDRWWAELLLA